MEYISVNFTTMDNQTIGQYSLPCRRIDLFQSLLEKLYNEYSELKEKNLSFSVNERKIDPSKTLIENKISNNDLVTISIINDNNPKEDDKEKIITVNFATMGDQTIMHYSLVCKRNDIFKSLLIKLFNDFPQFKNKRLSYYVNARKIKTSKTLFENRIKNNDIIAIFILDTMHGE